MNRLLLVILFISSSLFAQWDITGFEDFTGGVYDTSKYEFKNDAVGNDPWVLQNNQLEIQTTNYQFSDSLFMFGAIDTAFAGQDSVGITAMLMKQYTGFHVYHSMGFWANVDNNVNISATSSAAWRLEWMEAGVGNFSTITVPDPVDAPTGTINSDRRLRYKMTYSRTTDTLRVYYWSYNDSVWKQAGPDAGPTAGAHEIDFGDLSIMSTINSTIQSINATPFYGYVDSVNVMGGGVPPPVESTIRYRAINLRLPVEE